MKGVIRYPIVFDKENVLEYEKFLAAWRTVRKKTKELELDRDYIMRVWMQELSKIIVELSEKKTRQELKQILESKREELEEKLFRKQEES